MVAGRTAALAGAPQRPLDLEQAVEQRPRGKLGLERRDAVQEARLVLETDRIGLA